MSCSSSVVVAVLVLQPPQLFCVSLECVLSVYHVLSCLKVKLLLCQVQIVSVVHGEYNSSVSDL